MFWVHVLYDCFTHDFCICTFYLVKHNFALLTLHRAKADSSRKYYESIPVLTHIKDSRVDSLLDIFLYTRESAKNLTVVQNEKENMIIITWDSSMQSHIHILWTSHKRVCTNTSYNMAICMSKWMNVCEFSL